MLDIECADGKPLPYKGYIEADLQFSELTDETITCILLVVPVSRYNSLVPVLLGTNVLTLLMKQCKDEHGKSFLQKAKLTTSWYLSFRSMDLSEKELVKRDFSLGIVKSASVNRILVRPNSRITLPCYVDKKLRYPKVSVMVHPCQRSSISSDLDVSPSIMMYDYNNTDYISVNVSNVSTNTIVISPKAIVCELQPVNIEDNEVTSDGSNASVLNKVEIDESDLSEEEIIQDSFEEHLQRLNKVLERLRQCNLKLAPDKCSFFKRRVNYVGHVISEAGIEPDPEKIEVIQKWPRPLNSVEVGNKAI
ncbi:uncharacterized protein LOC130012366 [Patella vulgata]|uniref:uncharacterized protein LOC130012366 n=1 Tax=Patella vulgata TaxID=6465 RepID=UPI0024A910E8|nr:uncharacterized protein LOC130012366 [Patella vulgata]